MPAQAVQELKTLLEDNAPYQAKVTFEGGGGATGWNAPTTAPWFEQALNAASQAHFGAPCGYIGQGGTIPLMNMLSKGFPKAQMMVCGVLGPKSNAHGPNEFLHVPYAKKLTAAVAAGDCQPAVSPPRHAPTVHAADRAPPCPPSPPATARTWPLHDWPLAWTERCAPRGMVLIVHGLGEHAGRYDHVAQRLNGWGFAVRGYDQYGHGESGGPRGGLPSTRACWTTWPTWWTAPRAPARRKARRCR